MSDVQGMLNEISKVRILLLDDEKRAEYDRNLKTKERGKSGGSGSESMSASRSQSFDLLAPAQKESGRVAAIQLLFLSGPRVGETLTFNSRDVTIGPSSRFDLMLPTRNGAKYKLEHEVDQWILSAEDTNFAVNARLVNGLSTVSDGDILRFAANGPDLQFIEEIDITRHLDTLGQYEHIVESHSNVMAASPASHAGTRPASQPQPSGVATRAPSRPQQAVPARQQAAAAPVTPPRESRLIKKPESQKSQGFVGFLVSTANRVMGRNQGFTKKTGMAFDWQICIFWLVVGSAMAGIFALIIYAMGR